MSTSTEFEIGKEYIFTKSGSIVKLIEAGVVKLGGKEIKGFTVETRLGKRMFCPESGLQNI